jgi:hypothetical protein
MHQLWKSIRFFACQASIVFALSTGGFHTTPSLYRSTDGGSNWLATIGLGGIDGETLTYYPAGDILYYGENFAGVVYRSMDHGANWMQTGNPNSKVTLCALAVSFDVNKTLIAGSQDGVIDRSTDEGKTWSVVFPADTIAGPEVPKVIFSSVATSVAFATRWHSLKASIIMSRDRGMTWSSIASPDPHVWALELDQRVASSINGIPQHFWTGLFTQRVPDTTAGGLIEETTNGGATWHSTGFPRIANPPNVWVVKYDSTSGEMAAATDSGLFIGHEPRASVELATNDVRAFSIYPNPASSQTTILVPEKLTHLECRLFDVAGKELQRQRVMNSDKVEIELSSYPQGCYFARLFSDDRNIWSGCIVKAGQR